MPKTFEPDNQFVERLEWQLASELRRRTGLRKVRATVAVPRAAVAAALLTGILLAGVAAIKAADLVQDSWRKRIEVARAETEVRLQEARLGSQKDRITEVEKRLAVGLIPQEDHLVAQTALGKAALDLERAQLNLDEVRRSGITPREELYAPLVGGRDFVAERLKLEMREGELELQVLAARAGQLEEKQRVGLVSPDEARSAARDAAARRTRIEEIRGRLELRERFLGGRISALQVEIAGRLAAGRANLAAARSKVEDLKEKATRAGSLRDVGLLSPAEANALRDALGAAEAEQSLAALEVDVLEKIK